MRGFVQFIKGSTWSFWRLRYTRQLAYGLWPWSHHPRLASAIQNGLRSFTPVLSGPRGSSQELRGFGGGC